MSQIAAWAAVGVLAGLVMFQVLLAAGRPLGHYAWGGAYRVLPAGLRIASIVAIVVYSVAGITVLEAAGVTDFVESTELPRTAVRVLAVLFGVGVIMNAVSRSRQERVMAPVALVLSALFAAVGLEER